VGSVETNIVMLYKEGVLCSIGDNGSKTKTS
jgi:hypothetical protein